jgi:hypothetical protein
LIYYGDHIDFRPDPNAEIEKQSSPQGYSWYGDELISDRLNTEIYKLSQKISPG